MNLDAGGCPCRVRAACAPCDSPAARRPEGVELEITVEVQAAKKDGFSDTTSRIVSENARTLKFDQSGFEDQ